MTRHARRPRLPLAGAAALVCALAACSSASTAAPPAGRVTVPSAARTVTLSLYNGGDDLAVKPPAPVTITSPVKVRKVADLVAGRIPSPGTTTACGADDGAALNLVFRAHPGGPVLATAGVGLSGCENTVLKVGRRYGVSHLEAGPSTAARVLRGAGLAWKLPPPNGPLPG